jgi:hypothetical protein
VREVFNFFNEGRELSVPVYIGQAALAASRPDTDPTGVAHVTIAQSPLQPGWHPYDYDAGSVLTDAHEMVDGHFKPDEFVVQALRVKRQVEKGEDRRQRAAQ